MTYVWVSATIVRWGNRKFRELVRKSQSSQEEDFDDCESTDSADGSAADPDEGGQDQTTPKADQKVRRGAKKDGKGRQPKLEPMKKLRAAGGGKENEVKPSARKVEGWLASISPGDSP